MTESALEQMIREFEGRKPKGGAERWKCDRKLYADQLRKRIKNPYINQGDAYLCGTAGVIQQFMRHSMRDFLKFAIDLYEHGAGEIHLKGEDSSITVVSADPKLCTFKPPNESDWVDWIVLSSVRSSLVKTWWRKAFPFKKPEYESRLGNFLHVGAVPAEVKNMFREFGFKVITCQANSLVTADLENLKKAKSAYNNSQHVNLYVNSSRMSSSISSNVNSTVAKQFPETATHWIVLVSDIVIDEGSKVVIFSYVDYGEEKCDVRFSLDKFLRSYYGFIAVCD